MIVLDMDPGIDDAITLIIALKELDIKAISTVSGNVEVYQAAKNALKITRSLGYDTPVYIGAYKPLKHQPFYAKEVHGSDGLGNIELKVSGKPIPLDYDIYRADAVIATGPLTNIANAINKIPELHIMGGIYGDCKGNVTDNAEFNFFVDPVAADIVLSSIDLVACGLEITSNKESAIDNEMLDKIYGINNDHARLTYKLLRYALQKFKYFNLHDLFALFSYIEPKLFERRRFKVRIDAKIRGRCIAEEHSNGNVDVCIYVDHEAFKKLFLELLK